MSINYKAHLSYTAFPQHFICQWSELVVQTFFSTFAKNMPAGDAIDLGANVGLHSWVLGTIVRRTNNTVIAVEPDVNNAKILKEYVEDTKWFNMKIITNPVSNFKKNVHFLYAENCQLNKITNEYQPNTVCMESITIDEISQEYCPKFIKLDVEGEEINAIIGGQDTILKHRPIIATEFGAWGYSQNDIDWYYHFFKNNDYMFLDLFGDEFSEIDFVQNHQRYWNRFLIPAEYAHIIPTFKNNLKAIYSLYNLEDNENFKINFDN
jgi:FkbM family methyltransferase